MIIHLGTLTSVKSAKEMGILSSYFQLNQKDEKTASLLKQTCQ